MRLRKREGSEPASPRRVRAVSTAALLAATSFLLFVPAALFADDAEAAGYDEIFRRIDRAMFPEHYRAVMRLTTVKPSGEESSMTLESRFRSGVGARIEILSPPRSKGTRFLQTDETLWMYNPASGSRRAIRLAGRDSFQGSTFSNSDLSETEYAVRYGSRITGEATLEVDGVPVECVVVEAEARSRSAPYGRIVTHAVAENWIPLRMEYYAHSGLLFKRMELSGIEEIAGRPRATVMRMESMDRPGTYSTVEILELEARNDFPDRIFTQSDLVR